MEWLDNMNSAMRHIEEHLEEKTDYAGIAQAACCSAYHFQRMFSYMANVPLSEYIRRRKMTKAAFELQKGGGGVKVVDLAVRYGYDSPEAFTRAFQSIHGLTPTQARRPGIKIKAYPRIVFQITVKGTTEMNYKIVKKDAFQLYGLEKIFDTQDGKNLADIPAFWGQCMEDGSLEKLTRSAGYSMNSCAVCDYRELPGTTFAYLIGVMSNPLACTEGYTVVDVPASEWAVFSNKPHDIEETAPEIQALSARVYTDWLPTANYNLLSGYDLEMYFYTMDGRCYEEVWRRVQPK